MKRFSPAELTSMRGVQQVAMMDTCTLRRHVPTTDDWGTEVDGWVETPEVECGVNLSPSGAQLEVRRPDGTISQVSGVLRLSIEDGEGLKPKDGVTITHRNGEPLTPPLVFGIDGPVNRGPTAVVVKLVAVQ